MTSTVVSAPAEMKKMVNGLMVANYPTVEIRWQGKEKPEPPAADKAWVRVTVVHATGSQASLASDTGERRWNRTGSLTVQCFVPVSNGGLDAATAIAAMLQNGLQGKQSPGCVWFRDSAVREVGPDKSWYQVNFTTLFTYDDVR